MKWLYTFLIIFACCSISAAQKNSFSINTGWQRYWNVDDFYKRRSTLGMQYSRVVYKNIGVNADFSIVFPAFFRNRNSILSYVPFLADNDSRDSTEIGEIKERLHYCFANIAVSYHYVLKNRHRFLIQAGPTMARGTDIVLEKVIYSPFPGHIAYSETKAYTNIYYGGMCGLSYQYLLFNKKVSVGADAIYRTYSGNYPSFLNYRLALAYHFW